MADNQMITDIASNLWRWRPDTFAERLSRGRWKAYPHLRFTAEKIAEAATTPNRRLIINAPPRHGKSLLTSHWTPVWYIDTFPTQRIILCSYGDELATGFGREVRNEFENNPMCKTRLRQDSQAANRWHTPEGGGMLTAGVGGPISGKGFNLGILDDPIKNWQDAHSHQVKTVLWDWFHSTFLTRAEPGASIIIAMTRWSDDDLVAKLQAEDPERWEVINLPAVAVEGDVLGRAPGEALCHERYTIERLMATRKEVGQAAWDALYQQAPQAYGAGRVYENFSAANVDSAVVLRRDLALHVSMDFNVDPGMHVVIGQYDNRADQFTATDEIHGPRMSVRAACDAFAAWLRAHGWAGPGSPLPWPELHVFGDASGNSQWAGTSESCYDIVKQRLNAWKLTYQVRHTKANPPVRQRIDTFNEALRDVECKVHYRCHPRCVRLIADFKELRTDVNGLEDKHDHALSHASSADGYRVDFLRPLWRSGVQQKRAHGGRVG